MAKLNQSQTKYFPALPLRSLRPCGQKKNTHNYNSKTYEPQGRKGRKGLVVNG